MNARTKEIVRVGCGAALFALACVLQPLCPSVFSFAPLPTPLNTYPLGGLIVFLVPYFVLGYPVLAKAARNIRAGHVFDENFLMAVATIGALCLAEFPEAVAVMLFYQIGELFEDYAVDKSRDSIAEMMDICPDIVTVERNGVQVEADPEEVEIGSIIVVKPGERVALDGVVREGSSELDMAALTGESLPQAIAPGEPIHSGSINLTGVLRIETTKAFEESTVSRILELVENAADEKAPMENFITRFARYYTPIVCACALAIAVIPPFFSGFDWANWIQRGLIFLVVSCPCALVISIPLGFFGGIGGASRYGIMIKGSNYLEALYHVRTVLFDKTGTLTQGSFRVTHVIPASRTQTATAVSLDEFTVLELAAHAECYTTHPLGVSVRDAYKQAGGAIDGNRIDNVQEITACGIQCEIDGVPVLVGNTRLLQEHGIEDVDTVAGTQLLVAYDGCYAGAIVLQDTVKPTASAALSALKENGIQKTVMLTGDKQQTADSIANELGLDEYHAELLPQDKMDYLVTTIESMPNGEKVAFVGDGINDAPALMRSDVGVAMGALGSDAAIEAADVVLMDDDPMRLVTAVQIARKTMHIVYENIVFALGVKLIVLVLAALGIANMWMAIFADVGVSVLAILNAMRTLRGTKK